MVQRSSSFRKMAASTARAKNPLSSSALPGEPKRLSDRPGRTSGWSSTYARVDSRPPKAVLNAEDDPKRDLKPSIDPSCSPPTQLTERETNWRVARNARDEIAAILSCQASSTASSQSHPCMSPSCIAQPTRRKLEEHVLCLGNIPSQMNGAQITARDGLLDAAYDNAGEYDEGDVTFL